MGVAREVLAELECEGKELPGIRWKWPNCARQQLGTMLAFKASTLTHKNDVGTRTHRPWRGLVDAKTEYPGARLKRRDYPPSWSVATLLGAA